MNTEYQALEYRPVSLDTKQGCDRVTPRHSGLTTVPLKPVDLIRDDEAKECYTSDIAKQCESFPPVQGILEDDDCESNTLEQFGLICKSTLDLDQKYDLSVLVSTPSCGVLELIEAELVLIKQGFKDCSSAAQLADVRIDDPTFVELCDIYSRRKNDTSRWVRFSFFFNNYKVLKAHYSCVWNVIIDFFRIIIIYGYMIDKRKLRSRMIRCFTSYAYQVSLIEPIERVPLSKGNVGVLPDATADERKYGTFLTSTWIKVIKYKLAAYISVMKDTETEMLLPPSPLLADDNPSILIDKEFHSWFNLASNADTLGRDVWRLSLIDSLTRGVKKGCDRPTDSDCALSCLKTYFKFVTEKPFPEKIDYELPISVYDLDFTEESSIENQGLFPVKSQVHALTIPLYAEHLLPQLSRAIDEIVTMEFKPTFRTCPSFSSCTDNKRALGGHVPVIKKVLQVFFGDPELAETLTGKSVKFYIVTDCDKIYKFQDNQRISWFKLKLIKDLLDYKNLTEAEKRLTNQLADIHYDLEPEECESFADNFDIADPTFCGILKHGEMCSVPFLEVDFDHGIGDYVDFEILSEHCLANQQPIRLIGLKESLKIRGITTPGGLETWLLKPFQKFLSRCLSQFAVFGATTKPLDCFMLTDMFHGFNLDELTFTSGDYDDATNELRQYLTEYCIVQICKKLDLSENYSNLARQSLCDNLVFLDIKDSRGMMIKCYNDQWEAQPMGKVLSFTILCIINFALVRYSMEIDKFLGAPIYGGLLNQFKKQPGLKTEGFIDLASYTIPQYYPINNANLLINGDDCLFLMKRPEIWENVTSLGGLKNSIGKTLLSKRYVEMNSRTFKVIFEFGLVKSFIQIPFINFGLVKGLVRSSGSEDRNSTSQFLDAVACMGAKHHELVLDLPFYNELDHLFKHYHNQYLLSDKISGLPYYVPYWLGGLGLDPGPDFATKISSDQLKCCSWIYKNYEKLHINSLSCDDDCIIDEVVGQLTKRMLKEEGVPSDLIPFSTLVDEFGVSWNIEEENDAAYTKIVEHVWRTKEFLEFFQVQDQSSILLRKKIRMRKLNSNKKIWQDAYHLVLKSPMKIKEIKWTKLWHEKRRRRIPLRLKDQATYNREQAHLNGPCFLVRKLKIEI